MAAAGRGWCITIEGGLFVEPVVVGVLSPAVLKAEQNPLMVVAWEGGGAWLVYDNRRRVVCETEPL